MSVKNLSEKKMSVKNLSEHPLIQHKLTLIRDIRTGPKEFRELVEEISTLMAFDITRDISLKDVEVETPLEKTQGKLVKGKKPVIIPILRAGLGMVSGILKVIPTAKMGHVGLRRDPDTLEAITYYCRLPEDLDQRVNIVIDPMLATGGSAIAAVNFVKEKGAKKIKFVSLIAAPEGIEKLAKTHPDIQIYCAGVDQKLNSQAYILPGLGDAGDRLFGTMH